ncbi:MAG TPA: hypothetical protein VKZ63_11070 [Kofleriaceae bacterium]|nr:hypothetical protein [Kofleriaceae bacterium]
MTSDLSRPGARRLPAASWVIAAALAAWACKGKGSGEDRPAPEAAEEKAEPAAPPPMPAPTVPSAGPIDVTEAAGAPISIDQVTIRPVAFQEGRRDPPSHEVGVFVVGYRVHPPAGRPRIASAPVRIACRIGDLLLARAVSRSDGSLATSGVRRSDDEPLQLSALYRPDPYEIAPELCEITFLYDDGEQVTTAAVACFRGKELVDGACPAEELKVPARGEDIVTVERGELAASAKHFNFRGVFTLNQALPPGRVIARAGCAAGNFTYRGEEEASFLPLSSLPVGTSIEAPVPVGLESPLPGPTRCELALVARPDKGEEVALATACLEGTTVTRGACDPPLPE